MLAPTPPSMDASCDVATLYRAHLQALTQGYARALSTHGYDAVVVHSGFQAKRSLFDDQCWPLRPSPAFQHWCPLEAPDSAVIVGGGQRGPLGAHLVWVDEGSFWEQPAAPPAHPFRDGSVGESTALGITRARRLTDIAAETFASLAAGARVAFVGEGEVAATRAGLAGRVDVNPAPLLRSLDALRVVKTPYEVHCLAEANRRAAGGHAAVREAFNRGDAAEFDLHLLYLQATRQDDAETPYKNIIALGRHAATLHHVAYAKHAAGADVQSLLVDAGATHFGYASDVTRTYVKGAGATASAFEALVEGVGALQQTLCGAAHVDLPYEALHDAAHTHVAQLLRVAGVARLSVDELLGRGITRAFFPHGLGHSLGLQCHDVGCALLAPRPDNPFLRNTSIIATGQCFTIEPGVYFIEPLLAPFRGREPGIDWALVDALAPLGGVRIEDDVVVRAPDQGPPLRNLTREAFAPI